MQAKNACKKNENKNKRWEKKIWEYSIIFLRKYWQISLHFGIIRISERPFCFGHIFENKREKRKNYLHMNLHMQLLNFFDEGSKLAIQQICSPRLLLDQTRFCFVNSDE